MRFYLGSHEPAWLPRTTAPLFVSRPRLQRRVALPVAAGRWALDSGAFTQVRDHGGWTFGYREYAALVTRWADEIGGLDWAAPMDWPCEAGVLASTGCSVRVHQAYTVANFVALRHLLGRLVIPVLQGWTLDDYQRCIELYGRFRVDLWDEPLVGIGSVCRRGVDDQVVRIIDSVATLGLRVHAFGVRTRAMERCADVLTSCDSMAWSRDARHRAAKGITGSCGKPTCANCLHAALEWQAGQQARLDPGRLELSWTAG